MPLFSILIPTRGRPALLRRALQSVAAQEFDDYETIVIDDGDGEGAAVAREMAPRRLVVLTTGGAGQVPARNLGLARAAGRYIACLDDDDYWADGNHLGDLAATLGDEPALAYASGQIVREDEAGRTLEALPFEAFADAASIRRDNGLLVPGIAYDRALHDKLGLLDENLPIYWDWDWYLRLAAAGIPFRRSAGTGVRVAAHAGNVTRPEEQAHRTADLARLVAKHGLSGVALKNHESIAREQAAPIR